MANNGVNGMNDSIAAKNKIASGKSSLYVPPLELTKGQPEPIAANGGLSFASFDRNGDAGTGAAIEAALRHIAEGKGQDVTRMLETAPPGPIQTPYGVGFREYDECVAYIREQGLTAPEGGVVLPLRYTINENPSWSVVPSNALWHDPSRADDAAKLKKVDDPPKHISRLPNGVSIESNAVLPTTMRDMGSIRSHEREEVTLRPRPRALRGRPRQGPRAR